MRLLAACLVLLSLAPASLAACGGANMLDALARTDPAAHAEIIASAEATANPDGRFWRIDRRGVAPSYLFGTFHTAEAVASVPDAAWSALDARASPSSSSAPPSRAPCRLASPATAPSPSTTLPRP